MVLFCVQCCVCRKCLSSPSCRSELIDSTWVVIFPGYKCINKKKHCPVRVPSVVMVCYSYVTVVFGVIDKYTVKAFHPVIPVIIPRCYFAYNKFGVLVFVTYLI